MFNGSNLTLNSDVDIAVWFAGQISYLSMHHLVHTKIYKGDKTKKMIKHYMQLNTGAKKIQQLNPDEPDQRNNNSLIY